MGYSCPVSLNLDLEQIRSHLFFREDFPNAIPYRTMYYDDNWGFCLSYNDFKKHFKTGETYEVFIDATFKDGSMSVGEIIIPGKSKLEHLISTYICHPSMANDNLSGVVLAAFISKELLKRELNYSYRIIFVPETIGAIAYCAGQETDMMAIDCGLVISCVGGPGKFGYKQSWQHEHWINKVVEHVFNENNISYLTYPFDVHGSDERQYSSQRFRINTVSITKDKYYEYENYHTSLDDLDFVRPEYIDHSFRLYMQLIERMDINIKLKSLSPGCEPMLSKRNLYPKTGGTINNGCNSSNEHPSIDVTLWLLFYCD